MKIVVVSLRRSGSTIFWRALREALGIDGYDEPYSPVWKRLPNRHFKRTDEELYEKFCHDPLRFWDHYCTIAPQDESQDRFTEREAAYWQYLTEERSKYLIDETRIHCRLRHLRELVGEECFLIHLHRSPAGFATSHLLPTLHLPRFTGRWFTFRGKREFFTRERGFNVWDLEDCIGYGRSSAFACRSFLQNDDIQVIESGTALEKLLLYWRVTYEEVETVGQLAFGKRFISVSFENFCVNPEPLIRALGLTADSLSSALEKIDRLVHPAKDPHQKERKEWLTIANKLNYPALGLSPFGQRV